MDVHGLLRIWRRVVLSGLCSVAFVSSTAAQATSGINGKVTDSTDSTLPGVTVTITSPALQVPNMTTVTGGDGTYRFIQLPSGTFEVKYDLPGFRPSLRSGIVLTVGFIATINTVLEVGSVSETVIVSGASPVVDRTNNTVTSRLSADDLAALPTGRRHNDIAMMTPGMMLNTVPIATNVGLSAFQNQVSSTGLSSAGNNNYYRIASDGVEHNSGGTRNPDFSNLQEVNVTESGGTADVAQAGIYVNMVSKSGGNEFHGRYAATGTGHSLEGANIDDNLRRQGITASNSTRWFYDVNGDIGGRIIRDRLWFYGSVRDRRSDISQLGVVWGPDTPQGNAPYFIKATNRILNGKLSYQPTNKFQFSYYLNHEANVDPGALATRFIPYEASETLRYSPHASKGEMKATLSNRLLVTAMVGRDWGYPKYFARTEFLSTPAAIDLATQLRTGRFFPSDRRHRSKWQTRADLTYLAGGSLLGLGGDHELRIGMRTWNAYIDTAHFDSPGGNYILYYNTIGGIPHQPSQIQTYNSPVNPHQLADNQSAYVTDRVTIGSRLTMNLGFRYDRYHAWVPAQTKVQGPFGTAGAFPKVEAGTWNMPAPRAGFAYNLTKDGKSVVKGTYGWFNDDLSEQYADQYNQNVDVITTYRWSDPTHCNCYAPGTVNLNVNGPDFLSITGAPNNIVNQHLKYQHVHELTGSFERELGPGTGFRALYVFRRQANQWAVSNVLRPYSAYNIPITVTDPGTDGKANTGTQLTLWTFPASYAGAAFVGNERTNYPDGKSDHFQSIELTLNKRFSQKWQATVSGSLVKNHQWLQTGAGPGQAANGLAVFFSSALPQRPNDLYYPLNDTHEWTARTTVSYVLPLDIRIASLAFFESGTYGQRTFNFPGIPQQGTVTLRLEPYGAEQGPVRKMINLRFSKILKFAGNRKVELNADIFNVINSNAAWTSTYQAGPTFGFATSTLPPRIVQFGAAYEF